MPRGANCTRSHQDPKPSRMHHWTVQSQFLRRGGLKARPLIAPGEVDARIKRLRDAAAAELESKKGGRRQSGGAETQDTPAAADGRQGGGSGSDDDLRHLPDGEGARGADAWAPPVELISFATTAMEDGLRDWLQGPDSLWLQDNSGGARPTAIPDSALDADAQAWTGVWADTAKAHPEWARVRQFPPELQAYTAIRLVDAGSRRETLGVDAVLADCVASTWKELADEAASHLDSTPKAGADRPPSHTRTAQPGHARERRVGGAGRAPSAPSELVVLR